MATGRGGRKEKTGEQQLDQPVKTTLTKADFEELQQRYRRDTVGQKLSFAEYVRQRLLAQSEGTSGGKGRQDLLSIQLELAEISSQLIQILTENKPEGMTRSKVAGPIKSEEQADESAEVSTQILQNLGQLDRTIKQISQWLYDSSPEKI